MASISQISSNEKYIKIKLGILIQERVCKRPHLPSISVDKDPQAWKGEVLGWELQEHRHQPQHHRDASEPFTSPAYRHQPIWFNTVLRRLIITKTTTQSIASEEANEGISFPND